MNDIGNYKILNVQNLLNSAAAGIFLQFSAYLAQHLDIEQIAYFHTDQLESVPLQEINKSVVLLSDIGKIIDLSESPSWGDLVRIMDKAPAAVLVQPFHEFRVFSEKERQRRVENFSAVLSEHGLQVDQAGWARQEDGIPSLVAIVVNKTFAKQEPAPEQFHVIALLAVYNEADIIAPVIERLIEDGIEIYLIDNESTDGTYEIAQAYLDKGLIGLERFSPKNPADLWSEILQHKEELAQKLDADWFIHQDADEIRESPWQGVRLKDAIYRVDQQGYTCIDFTVLDFRPVDETYKSGDRLETHFQYFEFGKRPDLFVQIKAWKKTVEKVNLAESGGHKVVFSEARVYPYKFLLRHYPIRSEKQGKRKIFLERKTKFEPERKNKNWHIQYDHLVEGESLLAKKDSLILFENSFYMDYFFERLSGLRITPIKDHQDSQALTLELTEKEQFVQELTLQLAEKEKTRVDLSFDNFILQQKLNSIYNSRLWRLGITFRRGVEFFRKIGYEIRQAVSRKQRTDSILHQNPDQPDVHLAQFHFTIENKNLNNGLVSLSGWAFHEKLGIKQVSLLTARTSRNFKPVIFTYKKERMDVFQQFPFDNAVYCGFWGEADLPNGKRHHSLVFKLENEVEIIVDFNISVNRASMLVNSIRMAFRQFGVLMELITMSRLKKGSSHFLRGNFAYIKDRFSSLLQENLKRKPINSNLDLVYSAQFFKTQTDAHRLEPLKQEIDIIIPVYNGMDYLNGLFDSLLKNTNTPFRVIVVDDHSPDPNVAPFLAEVARQNQNIIFLQNQKNMGFVQTINYAAGFVRNHFVILNTDVEVPMGWLQRLMRPILNESKVASATPFTNAGTICSFPVTLVDNPIFGNLSLDVIDSAFQQVNMSGNSVQLPTGVGFCMGVNLEAWRKIGQFDEEHFGRGYGEENDWCMRALSAGYQNLMVPNLFVYHKHGGSFSSEEKQKLVHENLQKLNGLHPNYQRMVEEFIKANPLEPIRKFNSLRLMGIASLQKPILLIDHEIGGGANSYRKRLIQDRLQAHQTVLLVTYDLPQRSIKLQALYQDYEEIFYVARADDLLILLEHIQIGEIFYNNLVSFDEPLDMVNSIGRMREISESKLTIALHDYYPLCTSYTLLDHTGRYCNLPSIEVCKKCLPINPYRNENDPHDIVKWREAWSELINSADNIVCFSDSSARLIMRVYDVELGRISVQPHILLTPLSRKPSLDFHAPLNIGIVGALNYAKGSQMVSDVAKILARYDSNVKITVIGLLNGAIQSPNVTVTGRYDPSQLPDILEQHKINLCFFPSIWPETFSYVTSELMELRMPICAFNIGAPAERIAKYDLGYLISEMNAEISAREILEFYRLLGSQRDKTSL